MKIITACLILLIAVTSFEAIGQKKKISKENFKEIVTRSFQQPHTFSILDNGENKHHVDIAFKLPKPIYKAQLIPDNNTSDTFFFYYYSSEVQPEIVFGSAPGTSPRYLISGTVDDKNNNYFIIYFYPVKYTELQLHKMDSTLFAGVGRPGRRFDGDTKIDLPARQKK